MFLELSISQLFQNMIFTPLNYVISCLCMLTMMISIIVCYYLWQDPLAPGCAKCLPTEHYPCSHFALCYWERLHTLILFLPSSWSWWSWTLSCFHWAWSWLCACGTGLGVTIKMLIDWPHFMGRWSYPSNQGPLKSSSSFQETGEPIQGPWSDWHWEEVCVQTLPE
mgnify:CR=1 FL=1